MARKWFDSWTVINEQRMKRNAWPFMGSSSEPSTVQPSPALFRTIVQRNRNRSRRRYPRARSVDPTPGLEAWEDGQHLVEPSNDEKLPIELPEFASPYPRSSPFPKRALIRVRRYK